MQIHQIMNTPSIFQFIVHQEDNQIHVERSFSADKEIV